MTELYVIENERRNVSSSSPNASSSASNKRDSKDPIISVGRLSLIIDSKIKEQDKLWDMLGARDANKLTLTRLSFGVFSLFITGILAIFSFVSDAKVLIKSDEFVLVFCVAVLGMAMINFSLIRNIIALKHSRVLFLRQINCLRHSIDACHFALVYGYFPSSKKDLTNPDSAYFQAIGKHRKLPIDNAQFRDFHKSVFESSDNYTIIVVMLLTVILGLMPSAYLLTIGDSNVIGAIAMGCVVFFITAILLVHISSRKALKNALDFNKFEE